MLLPCSAISPRHPRIHLPFKATTTVRRRQNLSVAAHWPHPTTSSANFSISDDELHSRGFNLHTTAAGLDLDHLNTVFAAVGFPKRDVAKVRLALEHTDAMLWVECERDRRPVAFARATGDGVFNGIIWDVVVDPRFQGIGLGKAVVERIVAGLLEKGVTNIALYSEPRVLGFYLSMGFVADPDGIRGMVYSRKRKG